MHTKINVEKIFRYQKMYTQKNIRKHRPRPYFNEVKIKITRIQFCEGKSNKQNDLKNKQKKPRKGLMIFLCYYIFVHPFVICFFFIIIALFCLIFFIIFLIICFFRKMYKIFKVCALLKIDYLFMLACSL